MSSSLSARGAFTAEEGRALDLKKYTRVNVQQSSLLAAEQSTWSTYSAPSLRSREKAEFLVQETLAGVGGGGRVPEPPS